MPARTNPFQELIWAIEKSVAGTDCKVTESPLIVEPTTNVVREIDIIIEENRDGKIVKTAIECRDYNIPQDVTFIEQLHGKYALLRDQFVRVVAVSSSGFTSTALVKAKPLNIETRTLSEAIDLEWTAVNVGISRTTSHGDKVMVFLENGDIIDGNTIKIASTGIVNDKGKVIGNYLRIISPPMIKVMKMQKEHVTKDLIKKRLFNKDMKVPLSLVYEINGKYSLLDDNGSPQKILKIQMDYHLMHFAAESPASIYDYNEQNVTHSAVNLDQEHFEVVMVNKPDDHANMKTFVRLVDKDKEMYVVKKKKSKKK